MATTLSLTAAEAASVKPGQTRCLTVAGGSASVIVHRSHDGALTVAPNSCRHMGDAFISNADIEDAVLVCPHHGARLDCSTMSYIGDAKLPGLGITLSKLTGTKQPVYAVSKPSADGAVKLTLPEGALGSAAGRFLASLAPRTTVARVLFLLGGVLLAVLRLAPTGSLPAMLEGLPLRGR